MHNFSLKLFIEEIVVDYGVTGLLKGSRLIENTLKNLVDMVETLQSLQVFPS